MKKRKKPLFVEIPYLEGEKVILKRIEDKDAKALDELRNNKKVYRLLPTFLFEPLQYAFAAS